ncbi:protein FAM221B [Struthio camelus]|uniref:protein FAM221B n=1 Tax=Struthio camelus TaxID=8801 RepID=UPI003603B2BA
MSPPLAVLEGDEVEASSQHRQAKPRKPRGQKKKAAAKTGVADGTMQAVVPAGKAELVLVAKAMHRDHFGKHVEELFHLEKEAALKALRTGLYVGWRCPEYLWDCFRVGDHSKCFCGHLLNEHQAYAGASVPCATERCECQSFTFIPSRPEDVGEFWLRRRAPPESFAWRAKCRCEHSHEKHVPRASRPCRVAGCFCKCFESTFLCAACDRRWEEHETFFETTEARKQGGLPYGENYLLFAEMPELRNAVLTGKLSDDSAYQALLAEPPGPSGSHALPLPSPDPQRPPE